LALGLTGCGGNKLASFAPGDVPAGEPRVLPKFCEQILKTVPAPPVTKKTDAGAAYTRTADALDEANDRISVGGMCLGDERAEYAGKEKPR
jgi:hypothetical protein